VLHQYDFGTITTYDVLGIYQCPGQAGSEEGENQEADIGAITDSLVVLLVNIQAQFNLEKKLAFYI
jgi:hypothetical protein